MISSTHRKDHTNSEKVDSQVEYQSVTDTTLDPNTAIIGNTPGRNDGVDEDVDDETCVPQTPELKRAPGRPKLISTGRPKKQYTMVNDSQGQSSDSEQGSISNEAVEVDDDKWLSASSNMCTGEIPFDQAISGSNKDQWINAVYEEMKSLVSHDTWDIMEKPVDAKIIGSRIVLRDKYGADGQLERRKARLVARGFSQPSGIDFQDTFAPVARLDSFRLLVALSARLGLTISQLDVITAYLNSDTDAEIYIAKPPLLDESAPENNKGRTRYRSRIKS